MAHSDRLRDFIEMHPALQAIGNTPLVRLDLPLETGDAEIYAKCEHLNPGRLHQGPPSAQDAGRGDHVGRADEGPR